MQAQTDTRQRIVAVARDLIHARSYTDVGVAEICAEAGVRKGSFYHFFPSKRDLTLAVLDLMAEDAKTRLLNQAFNPMVTPLARIDRFVELTYAVQREWASAEGHVLGCPVGNLATELATQDEVIRVATARAFGGLQAYLRETLADAVEADELSAIDVEATAQAMLAYFEGVLMLAKTANDVDVISRLLPSLRDIRVHAVGKPV